MSKTVTTTKAKDVKIDVSVTGLDFHCKTEGDIIDVHIKLDKKLTQNFDAALAMAGPYLAQLLQQPPPDPPKPATKKPATKTKR